MKVVILAGGYGTRLSEETGLTPKPLVEIGGMPILIRVMQIYAAQGFKEFSILGGYKCHMIKQFFLEFKNRIFDFRVDLSSGSVTTFPSFMSAKLDLDWAVEVIDTGIDSGTAGRLMAAQSSIGDEPFLLTYGDGLGNVRLSNLIRAHEAGKNIVTVSSVPSPGRFGVLNCDGNKVAQFSEKIEGAVSRINGGFMAVDPKLFGYIDSLDDSLEDKVLPRLALEGCVGHAEHNGFWQPMDTLKDKNTLAACVASEPWLKGLSE